MIRVLFVWEIFAVEAIPTDFTALTKTAVRFTSCTTYSFIRRISVNRTARPWTGYWHTMWGERGAFTTLNEWQKDAGRFSIFWCA